MNFRFWLVVLPFAPFFVLGALAAVPIVLFKKGKRWSRDILEHFIGGPRHEPPYAAERRDE